ncbi:MAG: hypothetical protein H0T89_19560 [Deltaproteobacteria bacterium]|nr:hypothetical protein [Deltaproteobacteria bacterium]MDQ3296035.1 hypothetical protein [Myxococcota bacterium]
MESWLECEDYGAIERTESEAIVTEFFAIVLPVWPSRSVFVSTDVDGEERRIQIPLDRRSVALGYLRLPTWLAALVLGAPGLVDFARWGHFLVIGIALAMTAALLQFVAGRIDPAEAERRARLRRIAGIGAPPELLPTAMRAQICEDLADGWYTEHHLGWREAIERGMSSEALIVLAEYHRDPPLVARAHANLDSDQRWN